ncbi:MAG: ferredoxin [Candidatus Omnitrophota bacterium]|nr:NIL domain-containing protein [Candidatus Omnitrophota bacterium]RKY33828.1 MAG: ferredoxin [Candidatus Omnitrophota bacterium]RKY36509.1 MAG: ferredoxin [Candidatus Omnitrophota bacterium]RKY40754.1 MAG: ferredoxin [Candidatus Omnitrophota bacterium]HDN86136.1 ferredoxin [Candidatus Omnitrophota bacterium]
MVTKEVELTIPGEFKDEPIFYYIIKNFDVIPNIVEASFSTEMGWAIVRIEGEEKELEKLFNFLKEKGVQVNFR